MFAVSVLSEFQRVLSSTLLTYQRGTVPESDGPRVGTPSNATTFVASSLTCDGLQPACLRPPSIASERYEFEGDGRRVGAARFRCGGSDIRLSWPLDVATNHPNQHGGEMWIYHLNSPMGIHHLDLERSLHHLKGPT